jgi:hypothetical protein
MKYKIHSILILAGALSFFGCASYKGGVVQFRDANQFGNSQQSSGVVIGAEAITDAAKVKEIFYVNITEKSYFPIELAVQNGSTARILIEKDMIELVASAGGRNRPVNISAMIDDFEKSKMAYALLGFGIFSYMSAEDANKKMAADWTSKELPKELLVSPGRRASGFIYIKLPNGEKPIGMELLIPVENLETKATETLKLRL